MNIQKINLNIIKSLSKIYIFNETDDCSLIYDENNEIKILINHISKIRNVNYGMIIDENHYKILDSIIKLDSKNNHSKSYILFKNYNTFLNNINNKKYIQSNLEELLKNNYNMKIFLINNLDLYNNEYIFISPKYYEYLTNKFKLNIDNIYNYEYIIIYNKKLYYYNLIDNNKRKNILFNKKKRNNEIFKEDINIENNMKKLKISYKNNDLKKFNLKNKKRNIHENDFNTKKIKI